MKRIMLILLAIFAIAFMSNVVNAQTNPIKIVTGHPDLNIKVKRCVANGNTVILDLIITNMGTNDVEFSVHGACSDMTGCEAYDDEGNFYKDITVKVANQNQYLYHTGRTLVSGVPTKLSLNIEEVSSSAESFSLVKLGFDCHAFGLDDDKNPQLRNIPITRN